MHSTTTFLAPQEPIKVDEISPVGLKREARLSPLIGRSYDLLFNNCQLYILHLLNRQYNLKDAPLPWNIGAVAAGPLMLVMEVLFIGVFSRLTEHKQHLLASSFGLLWIAVEVSISCAYLKTCKWPSQSLQTASWAIQPEVLAFVFGVAGSVGIVLRDSSFSSSMLPILSFLWDLILVYQAASTNIVDRDPLLVLLNLGMTSLSAFVVCFLQWLHGWPAQDFFLVSTAIIGVLGVIGSIWTLYTRLGSELHWMVHIFLAVCILSLCIFVFGAVLGWPLKVFLFLASAVVALLVAGCTLFAWVNYEHHGRRIRPIVIILFFLLLFIEAWRYHQPAVQIQESGQDSGVRKKQSQGRGQHESIALNHTISIDKQASWLDYFILFIALVTGVTGAIGVVFGLRHLRAWFLSTGAIWAFVASLCSIFSFVASCIMAWVFLFHESALNHTI